MPTKISLLLVFFTFCYQVQDSLAQRKYSNEFLAIGVNARAQGMSNAFTAITDDVYSTYWNPAGLTQLNAPLQLGVMHAEWFAGIASYDYIGIAKPLNTEKRSVFGLSVIRLGVDNIPYTLNLIEPDGTVNYDNVSEFSTADYAISLSYAQNVKLGKQTIAIGGNAKVIRRVIGSIGNSWGFGLDLGALYQTGKWRFGLMARDITTTFNAWSFTLSQREKEVFTITGNEIPENSIEITNPKFILGGARGFTFGKESDFDLLASLDLEFTTDGQRNVLVSSSTFNMDPRFGLEMGYKDFLYLRGGVGNIQEASDDVNGDLKWFFQPNFGVGLRIGRFALDYALTDIGDVAQTQYSHIFSLTLDFKKRVKDGS